jgi:hypothetical protein
VRELLTRNLTGIRHYLPGASDGSQDLAARSIHQGTEALERLMEEDAAAERLFVAALAIYSKIAKRVSRRRSSSTAPGVSAGSRAIRMAKRRGRFAPPS